MFLEVDDGRVYRSLGWVVVKGPTATKTLGRNMDSTLLLLTAGGNGGQAILT